jgi:hypothetical protein
VIPNRGGLHHPSNVGRRSYRVVRIEYLVMEFLAGETVREQLDRDFFSTQDVVGTARTSPRRWRAMY